VFGLGPATRIYLAVGATDLRKGFEGLYGLVRDRLQLEPRIGHLFLFSKPGKKPFEDSVLGRQWAVGLRQAAGKRALQLAPGGARVGTSGVEL